MPFFLKPSPCLYWPASYLRGSKREECLTSSASWTYIGGGELTYVVANHLRLDLHLAQSPVSCRRPPCCPPSWAGRPCGASSRPQAPLWAEPQSRSRAGALAACAASCAAAPWPPLGRVPLVGQGRADVGELEEGPLLLYLRHLVE